MATPWFVVSTWPPALTRTRGSDPSLPLSPSFVAGMPVLRDVLDSLSVLAVTSGEGTGTCRPSGGVKPDCGSASASLFSLNGIAATMACVSAAFCSSRSLVPLGSGCDGPLAVARDAAFVPAFFDEAGATDLRMVFLAVLTEFS